ncbi:MAG: hypothetical protein ACQESR_20275 [Planctomycetota bacterium]
MQLAIVHYHLNRGGVTQVIWNHLRALSTVHDDPEPLKVVIFYGGRRAGWPDMEAARLAGLDVRLETVPDLEYTRRGAVPPVTLAEDLIEAFGRAGLRPDNTIVHIHNHALGKTPFLPEAVSELSSRGFALLLQMHDFAEDFRPDNYRGLAEALAAGSPAELAERIYPQGSAIHYAVLNGRDYRILTQAGVGTERLHALPNPVPQFSALPDRDAARTKLAERYGVDHDHVYVLYPVRGIRRKNVGEFLLWGAAAPENTCFGLTLPPLNPVERPRYLVWKRLAEALELPVVFEVGAAGGLEFGENLMAADRILTTSVAEGFGMVFLESWLADRELIGRDLPEITRDFVAAGLEFPTLSEVVNIPAEWVSVKQLRADVSESYASVLHAYGQFQVDGERIHQEVSEFFSADLLDFGRCSATLQESILSQLVSDPRRRQELRQLNPGFDLSFEPRSDASDDRISRNAQVVRDHYSLEPSGARLHELYRTVLDSPRGEQYELPEGSSMLDAFLSLRRFNPVRIH